MFLTNMQLKYVIKIFKINFSKKFKKFQILKGENSNFFVTVFNVTFLKNSTHFPPALNALQHPILCEQLTQSTFILHLKSNFLHKVHSVVVAYHFFSLKAKNIDISHKFSFNPYELRKILEKMRKKKKEKLRVIIVSSERDREQSR